MSVCSIVTLTMNAAVDESTTVERLEPERKLRCGDPVQEPGGGGINVARAIRRLGGDALAFYPRGGAMGDLLERLLDREGVRQVPLPIRGWTRLNLNLIEASTGRQYRFVMPGPTLTDADWQHCLEAMAQTRPAPSYIVASGSLPPGVPEDFYARVAEIAARRRARFVLDASGEPLRRAVEQEVFLLKPSLREFGHLIGEDVSSEREDLALRARQFLRSKPCHALVLSIGSAGALLVTADGLERFPSPRVPVRSTVGAGDSMVAGIVLALARGRPLSDAVRHGIAAAAATVMNPGTQLCRRADAEALYANLAAEGTSPPMAMVS